MTGCFWELLWSTRSFKGIFNIIYFFWCQLKAIYYSKAVNNKKYYLQKVKNNYYNYTCSSKSINGLLAILNYNTNAL